jgi:hypothetical protein
MPDLVTVLKPIQIAQHRTPNVQFQATNSA